MVWFSIPESGMSIIHVNRQDLCVMYHVCENILVLDLNMQPSTSHHNIETTSGELSVRISWLLGFEGYKEAW
jgi:hypothetical protein